MEGFRKNALFFDAYKAHAIYGKKALSRSLAKKGMGIIVRDSLRNIHRFVMEHRVDRVVLFINDSNQLHTILPFLNMGMRMLICSSENDVQLNGTVDGKIEVIDMDIPKKELFDSILSFLCAESKQGGLVS